MDQVSHILNLFILRNTACLQLLVSVDMQPLAAEKDRTDLLGQKECLLLFLLSDGF